MPLNIIDYDDAQLEARNKLKKWKEEFEEQWTRPIQDAAIKLLGGDDLLDRVQEVRDGND